MTAASPTPSPTAAEPYYGFVIVFVLYLVAMFGVAIYGGFLNQDGKAQTYHQIRTHFFGDTGKTTVAVSYFVIGVSLYSNGFSGYTIVGLPNEATQLGLMAVRWLPFGLSIFMAYNILVPRQRMIFQHRDYVSPTDFAADRFNSNTMRAMLSIVNLFAGICYVTAQFKALGDVISTVTHDDWDRQTLRWLLMVFMFACEVLGSMSAVLMSDFVQSVIMIVAIIGFTLTLMVHYGTMSEVGPWNCKEAPNCVALRSPIAYNNPGNGDARFVEQTGIASFAGLDNNIYFNYVGFDMFSFTALAAGAVFTPHFVARNMATRDDTIMRKGILLFQVVGSVTFLPIMYLGWINLSQNLGLPAFGKLVENMNREGPWHAIIANIYCCGALAAIMSTADSAVLQFSNMIMCDWFIYGPFEKVREKTKNIYQHKWMKFLPKIPSLAIFIVAVAWAEVLDDDAYAYSTLIGIQFGLGLGSAVSAFAGLFFSSKYLCAPACVVGTLAGFIVILEFYFNDKYKNVDPATGKGNEDDLGEWRQHAHITAAVVNIVVIVVVQLLMYKFCPQHIDDETRTFDTIPTEVRNVWARASGFGAREEENKEEIEDGKDSKGPQRYDLVAFKEGVTEPLDTKVGVVCTTAASFLYIFSFPWYWEGYENLDFFGTCKSTWCADKQKAITGIPDWAWRVIVHSALGIALMVIAFAQWDTKYMIDSKKYDKTLQVVNMNSEAAEMKKKGGEGVEENAVESRPAGKVVPTF